MRNSDYLSKSDPFVVLFQQVPGGSWKETHRTETIKDNLNPEFATAIKLDFRFETQQKLKFSVFDSDSDSRVLESHDFLGECYTTLGEIVGASNGKHKRALSRMSNI